MDVQLTVLGFQAAAAAEAIAAGPWLRRVATPLNIADHAQVLDNLQLATLAIHDPGGLLPRTERTILTTRSHYAALDTAVSAGLAERLGQLHVITQDAGVQATSANILPAAEQLRAHRRELAGQGHPGCVPVVRRRKLLAQPVADVARQISAFTEEIGRGHRPIDELGTALHCAADILRALKAICLHEAWLIGLAYETAAIAPKAPLVTTIVADAATALDRAADRLSNGSDLAAQPF